MRNFSRPHSADIFKADVHLTQELAMDVLGSSQGGQQAIFGVVERLIFEVILHQCSLVFQVAVRDQ